MRSRNAIQRARPAAKRGAVPGLARPGGKRGSRDPVEPYPPVTLALANMAADVPAVSSYIRTKRCGSGAW